MKGLILAFFLVFSCLIHNISIAEEGVVEGSKSKPKISEECKSLISQMKELRKEIRAKREEIMAKGGLPELEKDENGNPIFPEEFVQKREQRKALKEQLIAANCPKPPRKGKRGKKRRMGKGPIGGDELDEPIEDDAI